MQVCACTPIHIHREKGREDEVAENFPLTKIRGQCSSSKAMKQIFGFGSARI